MSHDHGKVCTCVADHNPEPQELHRHHIWPLAQGGPDTEENIAWLCPTSHVNVHELLRAWEEYNGEPPWDIKVHFNPKIRNLALLGYTANSIQSVWWCDEQS